MELKELLGWSSPVGLAIFFIGLAALFWGMRFWRRY